MKDAFQGLIQRKKFSLGSFEFQINLGLPLLITPSVWTRHGYSLTDILCTMEFFSSYHLWQCALLFGILSSNSAIKISFRTPESMVHGSRAIVIRKIKNAIQRLYPEKGSVLDHTRTDHEPLLPLHHVGQREYDTLLKIIPPNADTTETIHVKSVYRWKDIEVVPLWLEDGAVLACRVVPKTAFHKSGRLRKASMCNSPVKVNVAGHEYCGVDELCFFVA